MTKVGADINEEGPDNNVIETKKGKVLKEEDGYEPKGNMSALVLYTLLVGFGNLQAGFAIAGNN